MEEAHWLKRSRASARMARNATTTEARVINYQLARRYSAKAAEAARAQLRVEDSPPPLAYTEPKPPPPLPGERS